MYTKKNNLIEANKNHSYNTRKKRFNYMTQHTKKAFESKPAFMGSRFFEMLPDHLKSCELISAFKVKLKKWLVSKCFYSLEEFLNLQGRF